MGQNYGIIVVLYYNWIHLLDSAHSGHHNWIQLLNPVVVWYYCDTIAGPLEMLIYKLPHFKKYNVCLCFCRLLFSFFWRGGEI